MLKLKLDNLLCVSSRNKILEQQLSSLKYCATRYQLKVQESANTIVAFESENAALKRDNAALKEELEEKNRYTSALKCELNGIRQEKGTTLPTNIMTS